MNWYLEVELRHGTAEWDILKESFLLTFSFEDNFECIGEVLQEIRDLIFKIPEEPVEWVQLDWNMQLHHALEFYNVTAKESVNDPRNINVPESEGQCEVKGPKTTIPDISDPLKTKQVHIGLDAQPKFARIRDYWDEDIVDKVGELQHKYQVFFPTKFLDLKGIVGHFGVMKITLKPDAKPVK